jgi:hypothetical protein
MVRRLASTLLLGCFLATLAVAAGHNHFLENARGCHSDACVLCTGALAAGPGAPVLAPAALPNWEREVVAPLSPALPYLLRLDHSGGAPPVA